MAPSAIVEHVILDNALVTQKVEILPLEERVPKPEVVRSVKPAFEFAKAVLLEQNPMRTGSKTLDVAVAVMLHVIVIATPILLGLFYTDTINIKQYASMLLVAPPPPPPPPPPASSAVIKAAPMRRVFMSGGKLLRWNCGRSAGRRPWRADGWSAWRSDRRDAELRSQASSSNEETERTGARRWAGTSPQGACADAPQLPATRTTGTRSRPGIGRRNLG